MRKSIWHRWKLFTQQPSSFDNKATQRSQTTNWQLISTLMEVKSQKILNSLKVLHWLHDKSNSGMHSTRLPLVTIASTWWRIIHHWVLTMMQLWDGIHVLSLMRFQRLTNHHYTSTTTCENMFNCSGCLRSSSAEHDSTGKYMTYCTVFGYINSSCFVLGLSLYI